MIVCGEPNGHGELRAWLLATMITSLAVAHLGAIEPAHKRMGQQEITKKSKTADEARRNFVRGPSITPAAKLGAWFESCLQANPKSYFRVPLVMKQGQVGFSLRGARIGAAADAMEVYANDSALGIGLANRARTHCKERPTCAFWVEGRMGREESGEFRLDVMKFVAPIGPDALASANYVEIEELEIPEPGEPVQGFPIPKGARRNESLGGATSVTPGKNYIVKVYDSDLDTGTVTAFYERHLPQAERSTEEHAVVFSTPRGKVKVTRFSKGTRITLALGPQ